ncbi:AraC family transcriptional regulator [Pseudomonas nicosulfuronedens]|uniref:Helix-turn-helix transcriptional regulator n=1 Tax=Pseudomonas nicosulfuronedens TaxID=2571105 RepID=A0A5R9R9K8_9PSED|nr:AraC family transcriptional regulator [Pseudomonas nicosulfuronedens]MDH1011030.1 AraC family transcriptional regulator [Pseudomonas nicosulfuronedens]MDH1979553.1 AraC family transcriptional regulator [Pseudomonas nicosulfuronedens]MDH2026800.1 AraC family transcriptional regulator [Pseudomonas nicosulfuronedens]TLX79506.1 helix-turn-helix transcriptional regulator [Pseudomonas nicosulfuronedens]
MNADTGHTRRPFLIRSDNMTADDFGELYTRMFGNLYSGMPRPEKPIAIGGVYGRYEGVSFRRLNFRGDLLTEMPALDDEITFIFPSAGRVVFNQCSDSVGLPSVGLAMEKTSVRSVGFIDGHAHHGLSVRRSLFARRLATLLGRPITHKVRFQPRVDLSNEVFQGIKAIVAMATGNEFDLLISSSALMPARLQEMLVDSVLDIWPHNYSDALRRPAPQIAPRHVKLAMDYIQEHPDAMVSGSELAELTNVSLRALQEGFRRFVGSSIVAYQREVRLQRAYDALQQDSAQSVSEISLALGFSNVGRFCQYFQSAYGMSPADLRKSLPVPA